MYNKHGSPVVKQSDETIREITSYFFNDTATICINQRLNIMNRDHLTVIMRHLWTFQTQDEWDIYFETTKTLFPVLGEGGGEVGNTASTTRGRQNHTRFFIICSICTCISCYRHTFIYIVEFMELSFGNIIILRPFWDWYHRIRVLCPLVPLKTNGCLIPLQCTL